LHQNIFGNSIHEFGVHLIVHVEPLAQLLHIVYQLCWQSWMSACPNKGQNDRHVSVRPTCCRHVGQHVGNTTQQAVGRGTGPTCHSMSLADMSAICWQHDKYLAVGFEPMSMLLFLDSPATLPVRTCVLICRVAGISSNLWAA
jgi:hypothetical protein